MYRDICKVTGVKRKVILKRTILISLLTLFMFLVVGTLQWILGFVFQTKWTFVEFSICSPCRCHGWRSLWNHESPNSRLLDKVIGKAQADRLRIKLKLT